ncbi:MAG: ABC transporter ATP-binding protein [Candidatus Dormibacteria bacterium]
MDSSPAAVRVEHLTKQYGSLTAVNDLSFTIPKGTITGFVGPNGAGKTTCIRMLLGLVTPSSGEAEVLGSSVHNPSAYLAKVGAMIEGPAFYPNLSGEGNLRVLATLAGLPTDRVHEALDTVGLLNRKSDPVKRYSLGMKQRLGIASTLMRNPQLLILDEPLNGLDPPGIIEMRTLMRSLQEEGVTIIVSSHLLGEVEHVADWLVSIRNGHEQYCGSTDTLPGRGTEQLVVRVDTDDEVAILRELLTKDGHAFTADGRTLTVDAPASYGRTLNIESMKAGAVLTELRMSRESLEGAVLAMMQEDIHQ